MVEVCLLSSVPVGDTHIWQLSWVLWPAICIIALHKLPNDAFAANIDAQGGRGQILCLLLRYWPINGQNMSTM